MRRSIYFGMVASFLAVGCGQDEKPNRSSVPAVNPGRTNDADVKVRAPGTDVDVNNDKDSGGVKVRAPGVAVDVERKDKDKGGVKVKAPFVDIDVKNK